MDRARMGTTGPEPPLCGGRSVSLSSANCLSSSNTKSATEIQPRCCCTVSKNYNVLHSASWQEKGPQRGLYRKRRGDGGTDELKNAERHRKVWTLLPT